MGRVRSRRSTVLTVVAALLVWAALVAPHRPTELGALAFLRLPLEGLVLAAMLLVLPSRLRRPLSVLLGLVLAALCVLKVVDLGFRVAYDRPFDPVTDPGLADSAASLLFDSVGRVQGWIVLVGAGVAVLALLVGLPLALLRLGSALRARRPLAARTLAALTACWVVLALAGTAAGGAEVASTASTRLVLDQPRNVRASIEDERQFVRELAEEQVVATPRKELLSGLRGKDVLVVFVESYGRYALQSPYSDPVTKVLDEGGRELRRSGFSSRSAFLTSPTYGGASWLAHSTFHSGTWVDSQTRYDRLLASDRPNLMKLFRQKGWRTVLAIPSSYPPWPEGQRFYGFEKMYGPDDVGYDGPIFGYARVPDQFVLGALQRQERAGERRRPLMAEVDLATSHSPWTPLPRLIAWSELGDGDAFWPMALAGPSTAEVWADGTRLQEAYSDAIAYSLETVLSFVQRYGDKDLVVLMVGDHQPVSVVSGHSAGHDVPVSVIAGDPAVIDAIGSWGWQPGIHPGPKAVVWRMDAVRDRFLAAFDTPLTSTRTDRPNDLPGGHGGRAARG